MDVGVKREIGESKRLCAFETKVFGAASDEGPLFRITRAVGPQKGGQGGFVVKKRTLA